MTLAALPSEGAVMRVIGPVAIVATRIELRGRRRDAVTCDAGKAEMLAVEREAGLAGVIEAPAVPSRGHVALRAVRRPAEAALVEIVRMAGGASHPLGGEAAVGMATDTGDPDMLADQREPRLAMIETKCLAPSHFVVTGRAIGPEPPTMRIVGAVAADAGGRRPDTMQRPDVTRRARNRAMRAAEREPGHPVMVEMHVRPARRGMAGGAVTPKLPVMDIVARMAGDARRLGAPPCHVLAVAPGTGGDGMCTDQREPRVAIVIERREFPSRWRVARSTVTAALPVVDVVAPVTRDAGPRRPREPTVGVATRTCRPAMQPHQRETGSRVIERVDRFPRRRVVTGCAILAEPSAVDVLFRMAPRTRTGRFRKRTGRLVARLAGRSAMCPGQREIGEPVIEMVRIELHYGGARAVMFAVTETALLRRNRGDATVEAAMGGNVAPDPSVTGEASRVLRRLGKRYVAGETSSAQGRVRGAQRAGAYHALEDLARHDRERRDRDQHGEHREDQPAPHQYRWTATTCVIAARTRKPNNGRCRWCHSANSRSNAP